MQHAGVQYNEGGGDDAEAEAGGEIIGPWEVSVIVVGCVAVGS